MVTCKEIAELPSLKKLKIVGGSGGLDRSVRWVHFIDLPDVLPWVRGGELLFITGIGFNNDESRLLALVRGIAKKNLAGLVINVGPYIPKIPVALLRLADELSFPVFELPWEVKLVEVTQDVSKYIVLKQMEEKSVNDLLESILFSPVYDFPTLIRRAAYYGYDLGRPHQVGIARANDFEASLQEEQDEVALMKLKEHFEQVVRGSLNKHHKKVLSMARVDSVIFLLPEKIGKNYISENIAITQDIISQCSLKLPRLTLNIGLGNCFTELEYAKNSFDQARLALKFADFVRGKNGVYRYADLGVHKLLLDMESRALEAYYQETLGELALYDKTHSMELITTLLVYLQENGNTIQAAKKLFIHKNTLTYRLKKIKTLTGKDLDNMHDRVTFQMGLIIGKQLESL